MRQVGRAITALLLLVTLVAPGPAVARDVPAPTPPVDGETARVVNVTDGDTIKIDRGDGAIERLRYIGIDTPETVKPDEPVEPWGREASAANEALVAGRVVLLERDVSDRDHFERLLRYVWVETADGWVMVNAELVALGLAEVRVYPPDTKHHDWLRGIEAEAREAGAGMHGSDVVSRDCYVGGEIIQGCHVEETEAPVDPDDRNPLEQLLDFLFGSG